MGPSSASGTSCISGKGMFLRRDDHQLLCAERKKLHIIHLEITAETNVQLACTNLLGNCRCMILPEIKNYVFIFFLVQKFRTL